MTRYLQSQLREQRKKNKSFNHTKDLCIWKLQCFSDKKRKDNGPRLRCDILRDFLLQIGLMQR